uniref:Uncharacterized protein n=1 Tax=Cafeteria roenbergensis TaxID=33653 RepID=A0A7S0K4H3_CAFRO
MAPSQAPEARVELGVGHRVWPRDDSGVQSTVYRTSDSPQHDSAAAYAAVVRAFEDPPRRHEGAPRLRAAEPSNPFAGPFSRSTAGSTLPPRPAAPREGSGRGEDGPGSGGRSRRRTSSRGPPSARDSASNADVGSHASNLDEFLRLRSGVEEPLGPGDHPGRVTFPSGDDQAALRAAALSRRSAARARQQQRQQREQRQQRQQPPEPRWPSAPDMGPFGAYRPDASLEAAAAAEAAFPADAADAAAADAAAAAARRANRFGGLVGRATRLHRAQGRPLVVDGSRTGAAAAAAPATAGFVGSTAGDSWVALGGLAMPAAVVVDDEGRRVATGVESFFEGASGRRAVSVLDVDRWCTSLEPASPSQVTNVGHVFGSPVSDAESLFHIHAAVSHSLCLRDAREALAGMLLQSTPGGFEDAISAESVLTLVRLAAVTDGLTGRGRGRSGSHANTRPSAAASAVAGGADAGAGADTGAGAGGFASAMLAELAGAAGGLRRTLPADAARRSAAPWTTLRTWCSRSPARLAATSPTRSPCSSARSVPSTDSPRASAPSRRWSSRRPTAPASTRALRPWSPRRPPASWRRRSAARPDAGKGGGVPVPRARPRAPACLPAWQGCLTRLLDSAA